MVNKKVAAVFGAGMTPIMCVGETLDEREAGETEAKVLGQLRAGTGRSRIRRRWPGWWSPTSPSGPSAPAARPRPTMPRRCARAMRAAVAGRVRSRRPPRRPDPVRGVGEPANIAELMAQPDIDGALVGGASLDPDEFAQIVDIGELRRRSGLEQLWQS